ncbi:hypothetical protein RRG08_061966 [Elysia crispata]|uniref:Uncharacterized protein n=1 Tax=Elysia crispata TaxID=231223 RepID=A0AAE1DGN2_9GAST|nr:hypothetical protein RRG08_061966 [Elysia crispata]
MYRYRSRSSVLVTAWCEEFGRSTRKPGGTSHHYGGKRGARLVSPATTRDTVENCVDLSPPFLLGPQYCTSHH